MKSKIRYTPETITVYPIDMERLNAAINEYFHQVLKTSANITYRAHGEHAIIKQPKPCIIDEEFIGGDISDKVTFYVYQSEKGEDGKTTHDCFPTREVILTIAELEKFYRAETTLADFTKDRRGYNSRIRANEADWIRFFNK
jgi:hypothetical protein